MSLIKKYLFLFITSLIHISLIFSVIGTFFGFFSKYNYVFDICSQFCVQYLIFGIVAIIFYLFSKYKEKDFFIAAIIITIINIFPVFQNFNLHFSKEKADIKVGLINVLTENKEYEKVRVDLIKNSPDILIIEEIDSIWSKELYEVKKDYPFTYEISREDNFGIAVYSRIPIYKIKKVNAGDYSLPIISVLSHYLGQTFEVLAVHTTPPTSQWYFENTQKMFENIASYISFTQIETIVAGDINTSFFSYNYKNFIKKAGLKDAGGIFQPTWSAFYPVPMRISLDHIFVTKAFDIKSFKRGKNVGSDHFPVYAEIIFKK